MSLVCKLVAGVRPRLGPGWLAVPLVGMGAAVALAGCPRPTPVVGGCTTDRQCKGARICVQRRCVEPARPAASAPIDAGIPDARRPASPPFAMFGGDARHTGRLAGPAPAEAPTQRWSFSTGQAIVGSPTVGPDGTIYATSHDGELYALDPSGVEKWSFATGDRIWSTPAVTEDGIVYTGSDDDHLYAVDAASGTLRWKYRVGQCEPPTGFGPVGARCDVDGGPTIGPDGTIYTGGDGVYAVWPDGTLRWKFATAEHVSTAPALSPSGMVYAGCLDDALYAIRPDGTKAWEFRTRGDVESAPTLADDGTIYFGSDDDAVYALAPTGRLLWKVITLGDVRGSPALGADGTLYVGSHDSKLYAIAPDGHVEWQFAAADRIQGSPAVAANGTILFGSQDDHVYAVSPAGELLWYLAFDGDVDTTPTISTAGVVYAGSDDHTLRAFQ